MLPTVLRLRLTPFSLNDAFQLEIKYISSHMTPRFIIACIPRASAAAMVKPILMPLHHSRMYCQMLCSWGSITGMYLSFNRSPHCPINPQGTLIGSIRNSAHICLPDSRDSSLPRLSTLRRLNSHHHCLIYPNHHLYHSE